MRPIFSGFAAVLIAAQLLTISAYGKSPATHQDGDAGAAEKLLQAVANACGSVPLQGSSISVEGGASVNTTLSKVMKALADVGLTLTGKVSREQSTGFPKDQLAQAFAARESCVPNTLKVIGQHGDVRSVASGRVVPAKTILRIASSPQAVQARLTSEQDVHQDGTANVQTVINGNGNIIAPVTPDQKAEAVAQLNARLEDVSQYPPVSLERPPPTNLERRYLVSPAYNLYSLLRSFNRETVHSLPKGGDALLRFEHDYYEFQSDEIVLENAMPTQLGGMMTTNFPPAWGDVAGFCVARAFSPEFSVDQVKHQGWMMMNTSVEQADAYCKQFAGTSDGKKLRDQVTRLNALVVEAGQLLAAFG